MLSADSTWTRELLLSNQVVKYMKYISQSTSPNISRHFHLISQLKDESQEMVKYSDVDGETITQ